MGIGDSITLVACLAGLMLALPAMMVFCNLVFMRTTERGAVRLQQGFALPFVVGLVITVVLGLVAGVLASLGSLPQLIGVLMYLFLFAWGFLGLSSLARLLGMRISRFNERQENPFIESTYGAGVLTFAIAFPLVGWFVILPFGLVAGLGVTVLTLFGSKKTAAAREADAAHIDTAQFEDALSTFS